MQNPILVWATTKQQEGMSAFLDIASEYGNFDVSFFQSHGVEDAFTARVEWENNKAEGRRSYEFHVAWDYEPTLDCLGDELHEWHFVFAHGDASREMTSEIFFLSLFFYLDEQLAIVAPVAP